MLSTPATNPVTNATVVPANELAAAPLLLVNNTADKPAYLFHTDPNELVYQHPVSCSIMGSSASFIKQESPASQFYPIATPGQPVSSTSKAMASK
jgi:hypothetical protein